MENFFEIIIPLLSAKDQNEFFNECQQKPFCNPALTLLTKLGVPPDLYAFLKDKPTLLRAIILEGPQSIDGALQLQQDMHNMEREDAAKEIIDKLEGMRGMNEEARQAHMVHRILPLFQKYHDQHPDYASFE